ncbi:transposase [Streptomyces spiramyceticus]|uniref:transposase n=1 Tax=Streptomyces spiramyceticus TaxID=299717 RepID=UPI003B75D228
MVDGDRREVIDAIAWKFPTGSQWVHLPEKYGNWRAIDGAWEQVFTTLLSQGRNRGRSLTGRRCRLHDRACASARGRGP